MALVKLKTSKFDSSFHFRCATSFAMVLLCAIIISLWPASARAGDIQMTAQEAGALAGLISHEQASARTERTISLRGLGFAQGLEVGSLAAAGRFDFNLPGVGVAEDQIYAYLQFDQTLTSDASGEVQILAGNARASRADLNGRVRGQPLSLTLPVANNGATGFGFDYASNAVCTVTEAGHPTFAINAASTFTYFVDLTTLRTVNDAARALGDHITITLPGGTLSEDQFAAAYDLARRLEAQGRSITFNRLPAPSLRGEITSGAAVHDAMSEMLAHFNSDHLASVLDRGRADASLAFSLLAAMGIEGAPLGLGDIVIASDHQLQAFLAQHDSNVRALSSSTSSLARALRGTQLELESSNAIGILRSGHRPVITLSDMAASSDLAALIAGDGGVRNSRNDLPASELSAQTDLLVPGARSEWTLPFSFDDLPAGTAPSHFDLSFTPGRVADAAGQLVHVFMNDQLLRTFRLSGAGEARRLSVSLPQNLMSRQNDLRVLLQRDATRQQCNETPATVLAQLLPASGIRLARTEEQPDEFFELAPYFRSGVDVALSQNALTSPIAALEGLRALTGGIMPSDAATWFHFVPEGMRFAPRGSFLLYGVEPAGLELAPLRLDRGNVDVNDRTGAPLLSLADMPDASVVQIVQARGFNGLWVSSGISLGEGAVRSLEFDHGNLAIVDHRGVALWLNAGAPRGPLIDYVDRHFISDFFAANRLLVLIGVWSLLTLVLLRTVMAARGKKPDAAATKEGK